MEAPQKFRTAWNGFHRDDVVQYLEFLNAKHQSQVNQLNMELDALRSQVKTMEDTAPDPEAEAQQEALNAQLEEAEARCQTLNAQLEESETRCQTLNAQLEESQARCQALNAQLEESEAKCQTLNAQLEESEAQRQSLEAHCNALEEHCRSLEEQNHSLEKHCQALQQTGEPVDAYRRAETVERESRTRAELVYYQTNGVLTEASAKVDGAAKEITVLADQAMENLTRLQMAISGSKHTLQDAAAMMKSIRPNM